MCSTSASPLHILRTALTHQSLSTPTTTIPRSCTLEQTLNTMDNLHLHTELAHSVLDQGRDNADGNKKGLSTEEADMM